MRTDLLHQTHMSVLVMGPGQKIFDTGRVKFLLLGQVESVIFGLGMDLENFP